ncbi:MAG: hypothetical protein Q4G44_02675 [Alcaligenaceae bacterium]|nr:hypothetical protein [Alcaligenaceae bacterium]
MTFILESLVALFYYPMSSAWVFVPLVVALYLLFQWLYYSNKAQKKRQLKSQEASRERFIKGKKRRSSFLDWRPEPLFTKSVSIKQIVGQLFFLALGAFAILPFLQLWTLPLNVLAINAIGEQTPVVEVAQRKRAGLMNYQQLDCYTLNYTTLEGTSHEIERCDPLYFPSEAISYLSYYPSVIAVATE